MRLTLDSNILVYSIDVDTPQKHAVALDLLERAPYADVVIAVQALAEFLTVIGRKYPAQLKAAHGQAGRWAETMPCVPTDWSHVSAAATFASRYRLQFWDSILWQVARSAGAEAFVSEDLQDGLSIGGMTVIDPFNPANAEQLARLLEPRR